MFICLLLNFVPSGRTCELAGAAITRGMTRGAGIGGDRVTRTVTRGAHQG